MKRADLAFLCKPQNVPPASYYRLMYLQPRNESDTAPYNALLVYLYERHRAAIASVYSEDINNFNNDRRGGNSKKLEQTVYLLPPGKDTYEAFGLHGKGALYALFVQKQSQGNKS